MKFNRLLIVYFNFWKSKFKLCVHKHYYIVHGLHTHVQIFNFNMYKIAAYMTCTFACMKKHACKLNFSSPEHSWNPTFLKWGDQLSKIGNLGGDKITLFKKGKQMKKGGLVYTSGGFCIFTCILQTKSLNRAIIKYIPDLDYLIYYFRNVCPVS